MFKAEIKSYLYVSPSTTHFQWFLLDRRLQVFVVINAYIAYMCHRKMQNLCPNLDIDKTRCYRVPSLDIPDCNNVTISRPTFMLSTSLKQISQ